MSSCPICFANNTDFKSVCNHDFHNDCILKWCQIKNSCPLCRARIISGPIAPAENVTPAADPDMLTMEEFYMLFISPSSTPAYSTVDHERVLYHMNYFMGLFSTSSENMMRTSIIGLFSYMFRHYQTIDHYPVLRTIFSAQLNTLIESPRAMQIFIKSGHDHLLREWLAKLSTIQ